MDLENKPVPGIGLNLRRGGAKLRVLGKAHRPLHILLWQAHEVQSAITSNASAQSTLFTDIANWASNENRALSDVCAATSELFNIYASAQLQVALAFKSFRKDMALILEGEKRCDASQKKLQDAESKRLKLRRQLLRAQNRTQTQGENVRQSGDFNGLQTQLAEAERNAERAHTEACDVAREQEAVKLVILRSALSKLNQSHLLIANQTKAIFTGGCNLANEIPDPPPPGDPLSCVRYNGFSNTREILGDVKRLVQRTLCSRPGTASENTSPNAGQLFLVDNHSTLGMTPQGVSGPIGFTTSTPVTSPNGMINSFNHTTSAGHRRSASSPSWAQVPEPSAPPDSSSFSPDTAEPPPPYNSNYISPTSSRQRRSRNSTASSGGSTATRRRYQNISAIAPAPATTPVGYANTNIRTGTPNSASSTSPNQRQNSSHSHYNDTQENGNSSPRRRY